MDNNHLKFFWFLMFVWFVCNANARQIRYNRFNTEVIDAAVENQNRSYADDNQVEDEIEINTTVREINIAQYPGSRFKPLTGFFLPTEAEKKNVKDTQEYINETTTINSSDHDIVNKHDNKKLKRTKALLAEAEASPYPPAGFQPKVPFILPNEGFITNKTESNISYPAKTFFLPSGQIIVKENDSRNINLKRNNINHPACGSSTNPLLPTPKNGANSDPDSEPVNTNLKLIWEKK